MGQAVSNLYQSYAPRAMPKYRLLICGISGAGKTTILYRLASRKAEVITTIPTIGFNVETVRADAAELTAWDLGGRGGPRQLWKYYYQGTDGIVFVVDCNEDGYMMEASRDEFLRFINESEIKELPVLLLCNKQDLPNAKSPQQIVDFFGLDFRTLLERPILVQGCSATANDGLDEGINRLADYIFELKTGRKGRKSKELDESTRSSSTSASSSVASLDVSALSSKKNPTLQSFAPIQKSTQCPFAKAAKLWGGLLTTGTSISIEDQADCHVPSLIQFCEMIARGKPLDGFCIEIDDEMARTGDPEEFGQCVRRMLAAISAQDPSGEDVMKASYIHRPGWRFRFAKVDFFVTTFAPCYPKTSSRFGFGSDRAFILLQPEVSFLRHKLPADSAETNWEHPQTIRDKTRVAFKNAGRPYNIPETTAYPMVEHVVKPICDDGKNVVRWWTAPADHV